MLAALLVLRGDYNAKDLEQHAHPWACCARARWAAACRPKRPTKGPAIFKALRSHHRFTAPRRQAAHLEANPNLPKLGQTHSRLPQGVAYRANNGEVWGELGTTSMQSTFIRSNSENECGRTLVDVGRTRPDLLRNQCIISQYHANFSQTRSSCCPISGEFGRVRPNSAKFGQSST